MVLPEDGMEPIESPNVTANARDGEEISKKRMHQGAFLAAYEECGRIMVSSAAAGIDRRTYFRWMQTDPDFRAAFAESKLIAIAHLEDHAVKLARGMDGATTSERLLIKLLESLKPEVYNQPTKHEHSGRDGNPIQHNVSATEQLLSRITSLTSTGTAPSGT